LFGDLSGGHFNPAVSMTMFLKDQASFGPLMLAIYIVAQMVGGVVALQWNSISSLVK
jgi:glycerol uptake facilitator-like aquaporin